MSPDSTATRTSRLQRVFGIVTDGQTYKNAVYLLLALPLGFLYYFLLTFGFAFGIALTIFLVGIVILVGTVIAARALAGLERALANALLDIEVAPADDIEGSSADGLVTTFRRYLEAASTWRALGFLSLKFWIGLVALILFVVLVGAIRLFTVPLHYPYELEFFTVNSEPIAWTIDTLPEVILAVPLGATFVIVVVHLLNWFAVLNGHIVAALLGTPVDGGERQSAGRDERQTTSEDKQQTMGENEQQ